MYKFIFLGVTYQFVSFQNQFSTLKLQIIILLQFMQQSRRPWTLQQDNAVIRIVEEVGLKNWPLVSTIMRQRYNATGRSGKQCRQRWHNQLNPEVNKKPWTQQEEKLLFQAHKTFKNRWIDISKLFEGRTDNSIKNHFYSTIRRSLRRICKLLGNKNSTSELRNIKPSILSKIFQYSELKGDQVTQQNEYIVQQSKVITQQLLNFARSKPTGQTIDEGKRRNLQALIDKLNEFSKNYKQQKDSYYQNNKFFSLKAPTIIIFKSEQIPSFPQQSFVSKVQQQTSGDSKTFVVQKLKNYSYDWEEFEKRCMFVKQVFENQTESNRPESGSQDIDEVNYECRSDCLTQKIGYRGETYSTPRQSGRFKSFEPYKEMIQGTETKTIEEDCPIINKKIEYEMASC